MPGARASTGRPREGGDPYAVCSRLTAEFATLLSHDRQGLWVPAFAGTTEVCWAAHTASRRLRHVDQPAPAQQRVGLGLAAAERDVGGFRVARAAGGIDVVVQAFCGCGIEN